MIAVYTEANGGWAIELAGPKVNIGRSVESDIAVVADTISRRHCQLSEEPAGLYVSDLQSTSGTFVNSENCWGKSRLSPGDVVTIGTWRFRAEIVGRASEPSAADRALLEPPCDPRSLLAALRKSSALVRLALERDDLPSEALLALASCPLPWVQSAVARHPNSPPRVLRDLAWAYPREVERNPSLPLLLLEDPSLAKAFSRR